MRMNLLIRLVVNLTMKRTKHMPVSITHLMILSWTLMAFMVVTTE